jgi:1,4-dihydroxy-6-naphthoate synthase
LVGFIARVLGVGRVLQYFDSHQPPDVKPQVMQFSLAISPCPNDTFIFNGLLTGRIAAPFPVDISLLDIQELNEGMFAERFDLCKVSSVAALRNSACYRICSVGAAVGFGVGPLIVSRPGAGPINRESKVVAPGPATTAYTLLRHFFPEVSSVRQMVFSEIMPAILRGEADYGVVIHEGRFVYQGLGLECVVDLGALWESRYGVPLPLGCLVAHRRVPEHELRQFEEVVRESIRYSYAYPQEALVTMREHAQELDEKAIWSHVELYVNRWSLDLGDEGRGAFGKLGEVVRGVEVS